LVDLPLGEIDRQIETSLARIGEFFGIDQVTLVELSWNGRAALVTHAWSADGVALPPAAVPAGAFPWVSARILRGEVVSFARLDDLPAAAATDRAWFARLGTRSHCSVPLSGAGGLVVGILGLSTIAGQKEWPSSVLDRARLVTEILTAALARKRALSDLVESEALQRAMLSSLPSQIAVLDPAGRILAVNQAWRDDAPADSASALTGAAVGASYVAVCEQSATAGDRIAAEALAAVQSVLAGSPEATEFEYTTKSPSALRWFRMSVLPLHGTPGRRGHRADRCHRAGGGTGAAQGAERAPHRGAGAGATADRARAPRRPQPAARRARHRGLAARGPGTPDGPECDRAHAVAERLGEISADVHHLAYRLHPMKLDHLGLAAAARGLCQEVGAAHGIAATLTTREISPRLPRNVALCAYRILQEALRNVVKHSGAKRAEVDLIGEAEGIRLVVRDHGVGMAPDLAARAPGLGLSSMRERLRVMNGTLAITSEPLEGTRVEARIPLEPAPA
jgi:two-component system, NarL family, sensor kinase